MATKFKTQDKLQKFLAGEEKLSQLSRQSLAELDEDLADDHWLKPLVVAELKKRISEV